MFTFQNALILMALSINPFTAMGDIIDFTLYNARRLYASKGQNLAAKGLKGNNESMCIFISLTTKPDEQYLTHNIIYN